MFGRKKATEPPEVVQVRKILALRDAYATQTAEIMSIEAAMKDLDIQQKAKQKESQTTAVAAASERDKLNEMLRV